MALRLEEIALTLMFTEASELELKATMYSCKVFMLSIRSGIQGRRNRLSTPTTSLDTNR
jgi:hypothetical protein